MKVTTKSVRQITLLGLVCIVVLTMGVQTFAQRKNLIFVGIVRKDVGQLFRFTADGVTSNGNASWDTCSQNTKLIGHDKQSNGFWLCASPDIADRGTFYFGNVVKDKGYYYEISGGSASAVGDATWDTCWEVVWLGT